MPPPPASGGPLHAVSASEACAPAGLRPASRAYWLKCHQRLPCHWKPRHWGQSPGTTTGVPCGSQATGSPLPCSQGLGGEAQTRVHTESIQGRPGADTTPQPCQQHTCICCTLHPTAEFCPRLPLSSLASVDLSYLPEPRSGRTLPSP